jgi:diaminopimelate decarboxylase
MASNHFLSDDCVRRIQSEYGTPVYVYDEQALDDSAKALLAFPAPFGFTARFAMKALPTAAVLRIFDRCGLHIDASSVYEVRRALKADIAPQHIQLTAQQLPATKNEFEDIHNRGVLFNACSLHQLRVFGSNFPGREVSVRVNPGMGSGHNNRTNVGGPSSSFGIWHERLDEVLDIQREFGLRLTGMHTHIGSGGEPEVWQRCARMSLDIAAKLPEVARLSLGGGFKVARMPEETPADLQKIGQAIEADVRDFANEHRRELHIELEPGTFLVANAGAVVATVIDTVDTGEGGYRFIKIDAGMTEILRPSLYGAQHPIRVVPSQAGEECAKDDFLVAGHCCESGDILTPEPGNPEGLLPRRLAEPRPGDALVVEGAGAYCASLPAKNYNSFPEAPEVLLRKNGELELIRTRQTFEQMVGNEIL